MKIGGMKVIKNKSEAIKIVNEFISDQLESEKWYQDIRPELKAIILYGSVVKGTNNEDSDIDILFILPIKIEEKYTQGEYSYNYKGEEVNIVIRSIEKLGEIARGEFDAFQVEIFRESEIIWQKDNEVNELLYRINKDKT